MATSPLVEADRNASDYLFSIDPSGQFINGYIWEHCSGRPIDIYDVHGSGQCPHGSFDGPFYIHAREYVLSVRAPVVKNPIRIAGAGYDIFGGSFGLVPSSGHSAFVDNTPVIDYTDGTCSGFVQGPVDIRYDLARGIWTSHYNGFLATISNRAGSGQAYNLNRTLVSTQPVVNYYSVESGLYRYLATPYLLPSDDSTYNYHSFPLLNVAEFNGDLPFFETTDIVTVFRNPSHLASGSFICNEKPFSLVAFI